MTRCEHHVPPSPSRTIADGPLPQCPATATVLVHGYRPTPMACCDECAARIAAGLASVTTTPIT